jgi:hypothetical protein
MVSNHPGAAGWTIVLHGSRVSEVPAPKLPPESWLSPRWLAELAAARGYCRGVAGMSPVTRSGFRP